MSDRKEESLRYFLSALSIMYVHGYDCSLPIDQGGFIVEKDDFLQMVDEVLEGYRIVGEDAIKEHNEDRLRRPPRQPKARTAKAGYVYLMQLTNIGSYHHKIGMTTRTPEERRAELEIEYGPMKILATAYVEDVVAAEAALHERFITHAVGREVFHLNDAYVNMCIGMMVEMQSGVKP